MLKDGPNNASSLKMLRMKKQQDAVPYREGKRLGTFPVNQSIDEAKHSIVSRAGIQGAFDADVTR